MLDSKSDSALSEISNAARLISYDNYDWQQAAVDAMILQTSCPKLREQALQENTTYDSLMKLSIAKEQSAKVAALLKQASEQPSLGSQIKIEEQVWHLQSENKKLKAKIESTQTFKSQCYVDVVEITAQDEINVQLIASNARSAKT